jgi:8-oxo-dGTP pyrophosphatase MutT (NUDIX family)
MYQPAWDEITPIYTLPGVDPIAVAAFEELHLAQASHTKKEGNLRHYCTFFLPYDKESGEIYLGHHKKAADWIPPGGHIEPGETPSQAAIREMSEELGIKIARASLEPFALSVKAIGRPEASCSAHYDVWHLVHIPKQPFAYLESEYHDARWFRLEAGLTMIGKNPDFAAIIRRRLLKS